MAILRCTYTHLCYSHCAHLDLLFAGRGHHSKSLPAVLDAALKQERNERQERQFHHIACACLPQVQGGAAPAGHSRPAPAAVRPPPPAADAPAPAAKAAAGTHQRAPRALRLMHTLRTRHSFCCAYCTELAVAGSSRCGSCSCDATPRGICHRAPHAALARHCARRRRRSRALRPARQSR